MTRVIRIGTPYRIAASAVVEAPPFMLKLDLPGWTVCYKFPARMHFLLASYAYNFTYLEVVEALHDSRVIRFGTPYLIGASSVDEAPPAMLKLNLPY